MKIFVCLKEVPDRDSRYLVSEGARWVNEEQLSFVAGECDEYALEEALRLREAHGGEVVLLSMGGSRSEKVLRKGLAMGADRAILIMDESGPRSPFETAAALAEVLRREGCDLILAGTQSDDLGNGQTPILIAEMLGLPHASIVMRLEVDAEGKAVRVLKEMESGDFLSLRVSLPAVVGIQAGSSPIRFVSLKGIMQAKKKEIRQTSVSDLGIDFGGLPTTRIERLYFPEVEQRAEILEGEAAEVVERLVDKLRHEAKVL